MFTMKDVERTTSYCPGVGGMSSWLTTDIQMYRNLERYKTNMSPNFIRKNYSEISSLSSGLINPSILQRIPWLEMRG